MAEDYAADVKKYAPNASDAVIAAIVKHLGIALRNKDSSLVSCSDKDELKRVRDSWCAKKLGVADAAAADAAIKSVCEQMKADKTKHRVTFYYLCADKLGKLSVLGG
ncbi:MAG: DUF2853 family protein [Methylobacteriaceae bacterium]|nr:DUF2853 family protein [Methylobacteriaceae bacterium]